MYYILIQLCDISGIINSVVAYVQKKKTYFKMLYTGCFITLGQRGKMHVTLRVIKIETTYGTILFLTFWSSNHHPKL